METTLAMKPLLKQIQHTPLLWMLIFVPVVLVAEAVVPHSHTLLFALSVLAIVPLAALLSHATEAVAAKTGDTVGGLLNATLGNLTELVIAITALRAGQYMLVKASIAGAIVTNALFMLGACLLLGGLRYHVQEYNRAGARLYSGLLLMATVALLAPSAVADLDLAQGEDIMRKLSVGLAILLIVRRRPTHLYLRGLCADAVCGPAGRPGDWVKPTPPFSLPSVSPVLFARSIGCGETHELPRQCAIGRDQKRSR